MFVEITKRNTPKNGHSSNSVISYRFHVLCLSKFVGLHAFLHIAKKWPLFLGGGGVRRKEFMGKKKKSIEKYSELASQKALNKIKRALKPPNHQAAGTYMYAFSNCYLFSIDWPVS